MNKRQAKKYALAILSLESLWSIIESQIDGANANFDEFSMTDKRRIVAAAEEIESEMFRRAGRRATDFVARMPGQPRLAP